MHYLCLPEDFQQTNVEDKTKTDENIKDCTLKLSCELEGSSLSLPSCLQHKPETKT